MQFDVVVIGAGAAGLFCAGVAGQLGLKVLLVDHSEKVAEKIRISGGGRCNFTNRDIDPRAPHKHFLGENPNFCRSALSRYRRRTSSPWCGATASPSTRSTRASCSATAPPRTSSRCCCANARPAASRAGSPARCSAVSPVAGPAPSDARYELATDRGSVLTRNLVIATGGLSIPKIGASDFGYRIARQFGLRIVPPRPALVPLTFDGPGWAPLCATGRPVAAGDDRHRREEGPGRLPRGPAVHPPGPERAGRAADFQLLARGPAAAHRPGAGHRAPGRADAGQGDLAQAHRQRTGRLAARAPGRQLGGRASRTGSARSTKPPTRPWPPWPRASRAGPWCRPGPRATRRPK